MYNGIRRKWNQLLKYVLLLGNDVLFYDCTYVYIHVDINECERESDNNCSLNAQCTDTEGSYNCTCNVGYEGNGTHCSSKLIIILS